MHKTWHELSSFWQDNSFSFPQSSFNHKMMIIIPIISEPCLRHIATSTPPNAVYYKNFLGQYHKTDGSIDMIRIVNTSLAGGIILIFDHIIKVMRQCYFILRPVALQAKAIDKKCTFRPTLKQGGWLSGRAS